MVNVSYFNPIKLLKNQSNTFNLKVKLKVYFNLPQF